MQNRIAAFGGQVVALGKRAAGSVRSFAALGLCSMVSFGTSAQVTVSYTGPAVPIPDNTTAGVNVNLPVAGVGTISSMFFRFDTGGACDATVGNTNAAVNHTFIGDLTFRLTPPSGSPTIAFLARRGGTRENICAVTIQDGASPNVSTLTSATGSPMAGTFGSETTGQFSVFNGQNADGTWVLNVSDNAGIDTGSLRRFSLVMTPTLVNGNCGTANNLAVASAPSGASLCATGTASLVTTNTNNFAWSCAGAGGGTTANCSAPRTYTVSGIAGANGSISCGNPVIGGQTTTCTVTPDPGFIIATVSGCGGVAGSTSLYTTGAISANCIVSAGFAPAPVNAVCGTANNNPTPTAPSSGFCNAGTAPLAATTGVNSFTWACTGISGGANANCSAPRTYTVAGSAGPNGSINCGNPVVGGQSTTCTVTPNPGFVIAIVSGCGGVAGATSPYTTGAISANCIVSAGFSAAPVAVSGVCGPANGVASLVSPTPNTASVCATGTNTIVSGSGVAWNWTCAGSGGGTTADCTAPRLYAITATAGANGSISCPPTAIGGTTVSCTVTPNAGFVISTAVGCGGPASSTSPYTTPPVFGACLVSATFMPEPVNGACGTANGTTSLVAPVAPNLCTATGGTASAVASNVNNFTWTCAGSGGGTSASCTTTRQYSVTGAAGAGGTINCASPVNGGAISNCTVTPNAGFTISNISGCGGVAGTTSPYATAAVTANCTVNATFAAIPVVNGVCGAANGVASVVGPTTGLCTTGTASAVAASASAFTWSCAGSGGGTNGSCTAPRQYNVTGSSDTTGGTITCTPVVSSGGSSTCTISPFAGFAIASIYSDCGGTGTTTFVTGPVTAECAVKANFTAAINLAENKPVPTLTEWALLLLAMAILALAGYAQHQRRKA